MGVYQGLSAWVFVIYLAAFLAFLCCLEGVAFAIWLLVSGDQILGLTREKTDPERPQYGNSPNNQTE